MIDTRARALEATIKVGREPDEAVTSFDGTFVYVTNHGDHTVSVIETASHRVVATVPVGRGPHIIGVLMGNKSVVSEP